MLNIRLNHLIQEAYAQTMVMITEKALYLFGFKINAIISIDKIYREDYPSRFAMCELPIIKVGINFDSEKRTIGDWKILPCNFPE